MGINFESIEPTPIYPDGSSELELQGLLWDSGTNVAKAFRTGLKESLREAQLGQCCYCRRQLHDDYAVHLEHFIDKGAYPNYSYEIKNLALSCGTCNGRKNGHFSSVSAKLRARYPYVAACMPVVPTIKKWLFPHSAFPNNQSAFRWVSPHFHCYSSHIEVAYAWVYRGKSPEGWRTIRGCKLNELALIELRSIEERLKRTGGGILDTFSGLDSLNEAQAEEQLKNLASAIREKRDKALARNKTCGAKGA